MLYLDASALAKRYFNEKGSDAVAVRFESGEKIFTSVLSYPEIHSVIARKFREREFGRGEFSRLRDSFHSDWLFGLSKLELDSGAMIALPEILEHLPLKAGDAIHLSTAIWLRDSTRSGAFGSSIGEDVEFCAADRRLAEAASQYGLRVFDPEGKI